MPLCAAACKWVHDLCALRAIPPLGTPQAVKAMVRLTPGAALTRSKDYVLLYGAFGHDVEYESTFKLYTTTFGHVHERGQAPDAFVAYDNLPSGEGEESTPSIVRCLVYGITTRTVNERLDEELRQIGLSGTATHTAPLLAVELRRAVNGRTLVDIEVEKAWHVLVCENACWRAERGATSSRR